MKRNFLLFYFLSALFCVILGTVLFYLRVPDAEGRDLIFRSLMGVMLTDFALIPVLLRLYGREAVWVVLGRIFGFFSLMMLGRILLRMGAAEASVRQILVLVHLTALMGTVLWIIALTIRALPRWQATIISYGGFRAFVATFLRTQTERLRIRVAQKREEMRSRREAASRSTAEGYAFSGNSRSSDE